MLSNMKGELGKVNGTIVDDPDNLKDSRIEAVIDVNSINTRELDRDTHRKSADFFDVARFPNFTFRSSEIRKTGSDVDVRGDLTVRDVTRPVLLLEVAS
jgi:polyisoprenoid-binding protein YceI